jgi:hypothetical protein
MYQYVDTDVIGCAYHDIQSKLAFANKSSLLESKVQVVRVAF